MTIRLISGISIALAASASAAPAAALQQHGDRNEVRIVETSGVTARRRISWTIDARPNLQLGEIDGAGPYVFHRISDIAQSANGRILVVDAGSAELRFFDRAGKFLTKVGGSGRGPGEFILPDLVPSFADDSLLLFDSRAGRFSRFDADGRGPRTIFAGTLIGDPIGAVRDRVLLLQTMVYLRRVEGPIAKPATFVWFDLKSQTRDTIGKFSGRDVYISLSLNELPTHLDIPFDIMPSAAIGRDGFFITAGEGPEIVEYDERGRVRRVIRLDEPVQRVSRQEFERHAQRVSERSARTPSAVNLIKRVYMEMPIPRIKPVFKTLIVDKADWLWAELFQVDDDAAADWMVFDPARKARGIVTMPRGIEVHEIGHDYVLGRWVDDLSVEYVRRYRLKRTN
jgi:hypothetical protein